MTPRMLLAASSRRTSLSPLSAPRRLRPQSLVLVVLLTPVLVPPLMPAPRLLPLRPPVRARLKAREKPRARARRRARAKLRARARAMPVPTPELVLTQVLLLAPSTSRLSPAPSADPRRLLPAPLELTAPSR